MQSGSTEAFEQYATARIQKLRDEAAPLIAEADALEKALRGYHANLRNGVTAAAPAVSPFRHQTVAAKRGGKPVPARE